MTQEQAPLLLDAIENPEDLRALSPDEVAQVARELRSEIVRCVSQTGGHLASSLGAVELITGIHYCFETPADRLVLDVGHQGYAHKMLTGRRGAFGQIGKEGGIGKFLRRDESEHDHFGAGHAGTSISAALGMARAFEHQGIDHNAVALIGDGGMTAGMAFEALNHAGHLQQKNLVVVLNDNEMSISPNVGAMSSYLSRKLSAPMVRRMKGWAKEFLTSMPGDMLHWAQKAEESLKVFFSPGLLFEALGFKLRGADPGPSHGRGARDLRERARHARRRRRARSWSTPSPRRATATSPPSAIRSSTTAWASSTWPRASSPVEARPAQVPEGVRQDALIRLAKEDPRIVGITAAMATAPASTASRRSSPSASTTWASPSSTR